MRRRNDGPEELAKMTELLAEEDYIKDSTTTTEASTEEAEETTRPSECLQRQICRCVYGPREMMTTTLALAEENGPDDSATTTEASAEDEE